METKIINQTSEKMQNNDDRNWDSLHDNNQFDLLCQVRGEKKRLPYFMGQFKDVIGIFPFKDSPLYLYTHETEITVRLGANEKKIPTLEFWRKIFEIREDLNKTLVNLNFLPLDGRYFARDVGSSYVEDVVFFKKDDNQSTELSHTYHSRAKIRYFGTFE